jgi:hypothetical protein
MLFSPVYEVSAQQDSMPKSFNGKKSSHLMPQFYV